MLNALTIDVEDYYHVSAFDAQVKRSDWDSYPSRVVENTHRLLKLLDRHQVKATFFVLGWVGQRFPSLVRDIAEAGHEVGCHSYWHRLIYTMTPDEFRADLKQSRKVLEDVLGAPVTAYRAPSFSITKQSLWALDILREEGFRHDSSIQPIHHDRYGIPNANPLPHRLDPAGELSEFPPSVLRWWKVNLPVSGGGYFRLYPVRWTAWCLRRINASGCPFVFYIHPWELDPDQPRLPCSLMTRWRHYLNLATTERKLDWLLGQFSFGRLSESLEQYLTSRPSPSPRSSVPA